MPAPLRGLVAERWLTLQVCGNDIRVEGWPVRTGRLELDKYEFLEDPGATIDGLRKSGIGIDIFKFLQRLPDMPEKLAEIRPKYDYPMLWDNLAVLPVTTFDHWWNHQIRSYPRNRARQAEKKGVVFREAPFDDRLVHGIWEIYNECPVRQGRPFVHYGKSVETVRGISETFLDRSIFIGAYLDDRLIGFIKLVTDHKRMQACMMHIVSMMQHRDKAPTNALIAQAVRSCAERDIRYLVYQNFSYGKKEEDSLSHFKEINGFQRIDLPRYYVPLTGIGRAALALGLHRRLIDHFPKPVITRLREIRAAWYNRKLQGSEAP
jgi:hypothetical protein